MKRTFLFSFLIMCFSCDKANNDKKEYKRNIIGDWDWVNSTSGNIGGTSSPLITYTPSTTNTNYGLRIKKNDKAFLYQNGNQIKKGELESIEEESEIVSYAGKTSREYYHKITFNFDGEILIFTDRFSTSLACKTWPYSNFSNNFKKI